MKKTSGLKNTIWFEKKQTGLKKTNWFEKKNKLVWKKQTIWKKQSGLLINTCNLISLIVLTSQEYNFKELILCLRIHIICKLNVSMASTDVYVNTVICKCVKSDMKEGGL